MLQRPVTSQEGACWRLTAAAVPCCKNIGCVAHLLPDRAAYVHNDASCNILLNWTSPPLFQPENDDLMQCQLILKKTQLLLRLPHGCNIT